MNIFVAVLLAFLPKHFRQSFTHFEVPVAGSILGGLLELFGALGLLIRDYSNYMNARLAAIPVDLVSQAAEKRGESAIMSLGGFVLIDYLFRLTTILLVYFTIEGAVRVIAAIAGRETVPTLPLKLLEYVGLQLSAQQKELKMGARLRDEVLVDPTGQSLQIASCRPKQWNQLTTVSYDGQFYELSSEEQAAAPRPFVYLLRKKPATAVIRGIYAYDPDEALQSK